MFIQRATTTGDDDTGDDDTGEAEPRMMMFSMPDIHGVSQPDYILSDLPVFRESLLLSEAQQNQLRLLLEAYLESFRELRESLLPASDMPFMAIGAAGHDGGGAMFMHLGDDQEPGIEHAAGPPGDHAFVFEATDGHMDLDIELPEGVQAGGMAVAVHIGAFDSDDPDEIEGGPGAHVMIDATGPDGEELSEEQLAEVEKLAQQLTERIQKRLEEAMAANGGELPPAHALPPPPPMHDPQSMQQHMDELAAAAERLARAKEQLTNEFLAQVRTVLAETQIERWPTFERAITRHKTLPNSRLDRENVDLFTLLNRMNWNEQRLASARQALDRYELALHEALTNRNDFVPKAQKQMDEALRSGDPASAIGAVERAADLRVRVRDTNDQYAEELAFAAGDDEAGEEFRRAFRSAAYPRVYRTTFAQRVFDKALQLEDLDPDIRAAIQSMYDAYLAELNIVNDKIRTAIRRHQPAEPKEMLEHMAAQFAGEDEAAFMVPGMHGGPIGEAMAARTALDDRHVEQLHHLLTEQQIEELPKKRERPRMQFMRMGGPG